MISKSKLAEEIQALQASATAVCYACKLRHTPGCWGPACADIIRIVNAIDPLVSEYFRLELAEKRAQLKYTTLPVWQRCLPLGGTEDTPNTTDEAITFIEEVLLSPRRHMEENTAYANSDIPPEGWGYTLLQFVLGWDTGSRPSTLDTAALPAVIPEPTRSPVLSAPIAAVSHPDTDATTYIASAPASLTATPAHAAEPNHGSFTEAASNSAQMAGTVGTRHVNFAARAFRKKKLNSTKSGIRMRTAGTKI